MAVSAVTRRVQPMIPATLFVGMHIEGANANALSPRLSRNCDFKDIDGTTVFTKQLEPMGRSGYGR
jgi:hypothetical protein